MAILRTTSLSLILLICLSQAAFAGPLQKAVEAVGDTASAIGESIEDTVDTVTGDRTPAIVRGEIDVAEKKALSRLFSEQPASKKLFDRSYGYAVFDSSTKGFVISSASGAGVAVTRGGAARTYMRMLSVGANVGGGIQFYYIVFLFEDKRTFDYFVNKGWEAKGNAAAVIGKDTLDADIQFVNGKAIFKLSNTGLMLGANISGTKYWKDDALNGKG